METETQETPLVLSREERAAQIRRDAEEALRELYEADKQQEIADFHKQQEESRVRLAQLYAEHAPGVRKTYEEYLAGIVHAANLMAILKRKLDPLTTAGVALDFPVKLLPDLALGCDYDPSAINESAFSIAVKQAKKSGFTVPEVRYPE